MLADRDTQDPGHTDALNAKGLVVFASPEVWNAFCPFGAQTCHKLAESPRLAFNSQFSHQHRSGAGSTDLFPNTQQTALTVFHQLRAYGAAV